MLERLKLFQSWGHQIKIFSALDKKLRKASDKNFYEIDGLKVEVEWGDFQPHELKDKKNFESYFLGLLNRENPDLVLAHYTDFFALTSALFWNSDRTWVDQTDDEYPRLNQLKEFGSLAEDYKKIRHFMVASHFMEKSVKKSFPESQIHFLPNIISGFEARPESGAEFKEKSFWLHINPTAVKGIDFTLDLARELPEEKFLLVGNWGGNFPENLPANVQTLERQDSLAKVLKEAKGLLMPSRWQEAFGRVPLEAMAYGCPVISSDRGALSETVGQGGVVLPLDLNLWKLSMRQKADFWRHQIAAGYQRFALYRRDVDLAYEKLKNNFPC